MGDSVNLATRLEGINRQFRTNLIISEASFLQVKDHVIAREFDLIRVKGKTHPVRVYQLRAMAEQSHAYADWVARIAKGLRAYRGGEWHSALEIFEGLNSADPGDGPSQVFIERCLNLLTEPQVGAWHGVFVMRTK